MHDSIPTGSKVDSVTDPPASLPIHIHLVRLSVAHKAVLQIRGVSLPKRANVRSPLTPRRDYQEVPPAPLRTIPSMLDLRPDDQPSPSNSTDGTPGVSGSETPVFGADPQQLSFTKDGKLSTSPISLKPPSDLRRRHGGSDGASRRQLDGSGVEKEIQWVPRRKRKNADERAKYDAEGESGPQSCVPVADKANMKCSRRSVCTLVSHSSPRQSYHGSSAFSSLLSVLGYRGLSMVCIVLSSPAAA